MRRWSGVSLVAVLTTSSALAAEVVLDAAPRADLRPAHLQAIVQYPVTVRAEFIIDRTGRGRDIRIDAATPSLFADAVHRVLDRPEAFWPAQGQCRFLEQDARMAFAFGAPADGAPVSILNFEALAIHPADSAPIPQSDAIFLAISGWDLRARPTLEGHTADERPPLPKSKIQVRIPDELRHSQGLAGYVWLAFEVTTKGRPRDIAVHDVWSKVAGKERHLGVEAMRALREVEFEPAQRDGTPVARRSCYLVTFTIAAWAGGDR